VSPSLAADAGTAPGNDSPCIHGRSVPVTGLSNGNAQYCIVLCCVAVVTEEKSIGILKKTLCRELKSYRISDLSVSEAGCKDNQRNGNARTHVHNDKLAVKEAVDFHVLLNVALCVP